MQNFIFKFLFWDICFKTKQFPKNINHIVLQVKKCNIPPPLSEKTNFYLRVDSLNKGFFQTGLHKS